MRVLLVDPPHDSFLGFHRFYFPLGLVSVGTVLRDAGHEVLVLDADHLPGGFCLANADAATLWDLYYKGVEDRDHPIWFGIREAVRSFEPDVLGVTVLSCKVPSALQTVRLAREVRAGLRVVLGGDHAVPFGPELAREPGVDAVVVGEGEETARELLSAWERGTPLGGIAGLCHRDAGHVGRPRRRRLIDNLDALPIPDRTLLSDLPGYRPLDLGLMMTSRGCPGRCGFCGIAPALGRRVRFRSIEGCLREIELCRERHGTDYFSFRDGTFTIDRARALALCERLAAARLGIAWECLTRPDCLDDELVGLMVRAGCVQVRLGLESGSPRILQYLRKDGTVEDYERTAAILDRQGLFWSAYLMLGVPEETLEDIRLTFDLVERLQPGFLTVSRFVPLPGTRLYRDAAALGRPIDWRSQNNRCLDQSYSRHIPPERFRDVMEQATRYAAEYNRAHALGPRWTDRRLKGGFEDRLGAPAAGDGGAGDPLDAVAAP